MQLGSKPPPQQTPRPRHVYMSSRSLEYKSDIQTVFWGLSWIHDVLLALESTVCSPATLIWRSENSRTRFPAITALSLPPQPESTNLKCHVYPDHPGLGIYVSRLRYFVYLWSILPYILDYRNLLCRRFLLYLYTLKRNLQGPGKRR